MINFKNLTKQKILAYTETKKTYSYLVRGDSIDTCMETIDYCKKNNYTINIRGGGYSYADVILNNGNFILDVTPMNKILEFNKETGVIRVEAGVTFAQIFNKKRV